jgi:asparagine synthase (glutamine-hydrolysing)
VPVGLAHRRLAVVDLDARGRQPLRHGKARVVFNGEIYNYRVLRQELMAAGAVFGTETDTEVIPALYERVGDGLLDRLRGIFAFAVWDGRRLLLARDRLGVKPLFVAERGDGLLFASEPKALMASGLVDGGVDVQALHDYLGLCYVPGPRTLLRGVRQLPAGHALVWEAGRCGSGGGGGLFFRWGEHRRRAFGRRVKRRGSGCGRRWLSS